MKQTLGLIFGGASTEYEVSLTSATSIIEHLPKKEGHVIKIGISKLGMWYLVPADVSPMDDTLWEREENRLTVMLGGEQIGILYEHTKTWIKIDLAFPIIHGQYGEDGVLGMILDQLAIPYIGCQTEANLVCFNKRFTHQIAKSVGIKTTKSVIVSEADFDSKELDDWQFPLFIKPLKGGSSIGISKVSKLSEVKKAIALAFEYDTQVIIEEAVSGVEVGCGILQNKDELLVGNLDKIELQTEFFDFVEKYNLEQTTIEQPAKLSTEIIEEVKRQAVLLFKEYGCRDLSRFDFFVTEDGAIYLNEVNTFPGFTAHSRFPMMMATTGITFTEILTILLNNHQVGDLYER